MKVVIAGGDSGKDETFVKGLLVGLSGAGKSTCMAKAPLPMIIEPSAQAMASIRSANPQAIVIHVETIKDVRDVIYSLKNAKRVESGGLPAIEVTLREDPSTAKKGQKPQTFGTHIVQTVCLDDLEEIQEMLKREVQADQRYQKELAKVGEDGMTMRMWGTVIDRMLGIVRSLRSIPANVLVAAKVGRISDDGQHFHELILAGKQMKTLLPGLFNCVGYVYKRDPDERDERLHIVGFDLPEKYLSKGHPALGAIEDPEPVIWWAKMRENLGNLEKGEKPKQSSLPKGSPVPMKRKSKKDAQPIEKEESIERKVSLLCEDINRAKDEKELSLCNASVEKLSSELDPSSKALLQSALEARARTLSLDKPSSSKEESDSQEKEAKDETPNKEEATETNETVKGEEAKTETKPEPKKRLKRISMKVPK